MEDPDLQRTQGCLAPLLGFLEGILLGPWEGELEGVRSEPSDRTGLPRRMARILEDCGYLEGLRLKLQGALSGEVQETIRSLAYLFELEAEPVGPFKLPFVGQTWMLRRKTLNRFREQAWRAFHAALLSAYSLHALDFAPVDGAPDGEMEFRARVVERRGAPEDAGLEPALVHKLNNHLAGIASYASLMVAEGRDTPETLERLKLILGAAHASADLIRRAAAEPPAAAPPG